MVFGWGKKKSSSSDSSSSKEINISEVSEIINYLSELRLKTLLSESSKIQSNIKSSLDSLLKISTTLSKDNLKVDDIDKNLRVLVVRGKTQVIDSIQKECDTKLPKLTSEDNVIEFNIEVSKILKKIGDVLGRQSRVIHIFAKKYADDLKRILSDMRSSSEELNTLVQSYMHTKNNALEIHELIKNHHDILNKNKSILDRNAELEQSLDKQLKNIEEKKSKITQMKSSDEFKNSKEIEKQISALLPSKQNLKHEIDSQFIKISRPLGKYVYVSSLDKPQKEILEKLTVSPYDVLIPENTESIITILQAVKKAILSNSISVKDVDKSNLYLDETSELISSFSKKILEIKRKEDALILEQSKIFDYSKLRDAENELGDLENDIEDIRRRIDVYKKEIDEHSSVLTSIIANIEQKIKQISGTSYSISGQT